MQDKLILIRKKNNISQEFLANLIGITTKQFGLKERGEYKFDGDEMFAISKYLDMAIEDIFLPTTHQNGEKKRGVNYGRNKI